MIVTIIEFFANISAVSTSLIQEPAVVVADQDLGPIWEPDPVKFSFETPAWYVVGILIFLTCCYLILRRIIHYRQNAYRREAIKELTQINQSKSNNELHLQLSELLVILKMVAFKAYGRKNVATLYGKPWLLFLESKAKNTPFSNYEAIISRTIYENARPDIKELDELKRLSKKWIQTHA
jgi:hypothetical protein